MLFVRSIVAAALGVAASCVLAEVEIVDRPVGSQSSVSQQSADSARSQPGASVITTSDVSAGDSIEQPQTGSGSNIPPVKSNPTAELFYQMQVMQQEVQSLRGMVEEQGYLIKQLKQQRLDDYVDLDRRISALGGAVSTAAPKPDVNSSSVSSSGNTGGIVDTEKAHYQKAVDPILGSNKDLDAAIALLHEHLQRYPNGLYTGNAQYWLGEAYLVKDNLPESQKWFEKLLNDYPLHGKIPAAKFKLGIVYHKTGLMAQSKMLLEEVARSGSPAATRASDYLKANF